MLVSAPSLSLAKSAVVLNRRGRPLLNSGDNCHLTPCHPPTKMVSPQRSRLRTFSYGGSGSMGPAWYRHKRAGGAIGVRSRWRLHFARFAGGPR